MCASFLREALILTSSSWRMVLKQKFIKRIIPFFLDLLWFLLLLWKLDSYFSIWEASTEHFYYLKFNIRKDRLFLFRRLDYFLLFGIDFWWILFNLILNLSGFVLLDFFSQLFFSHLDFILIYKCYRALADLEIWPALRAF